MRFALDRDEELVPHAERVHQRFNEWIAQQENRGASFTDEQRRWLDMMRDHVATSLEIGIDDFDLVPFANEGGLAKASKVFGTQLKEIVAELNDALAA
ncbi:MAG: type I restriction-modification enzyme R subunit C-terminal domain-containing protein [Gemmatimonadota bacterium]